MIGVQDVRLRVQCEANIDHAKIIPLQNFFRSPTDVSRWQPIDNTHADMVLKRHFAQKLGEIICGTSPMYIYRPGDRSPIGRCAICGAKLSFEIQDLEPDV